MESRAVDPGRVRLCYFIAFANGAALMAFEIIGSRILSPHFGNTLFVWGSLISVFMAGMAAGYYLGGWLGDRWPGRGPVCLMLLIPALLLLALPQEAVRFSGWLAEFEMGPRSGPLLASAILFFLPTVFIGAVSPCLFVLLLRDLHTAGRRLGQLYAISTLGSILGTLGAAFYLILWFGTLLSLRLTGALLLLLAILAWQGFKSSEAG